MKSRTNKNDRKRQRRKDFSHGRDWQTTPQDQRSSYPKSHLAQRADAAHRAQLAGIKPLPSPIRTGLPPDRWRLINDPRVQDFDIDLSPGGINTIPSRPNLRQLMRDIQDAMAQQMFHGTPLALQRCEPNPPRPSLTREMKVGEITGYRCWRLKPDMMLRSTYMRDIWHPNEIMVGREIEDWSERGIHAWKDPNSQEFNDYVRMYLRMNDGPFFKGERHVIITGTVLLWGDVVEHEHGYRAEFAKIASIDWIYPNAELMGHERETLYKLRQRYGVT